MDARTPHTTLTIGKLAKAAGVGVETIRFYEREGLIAQPSRGRSSYGRSSYRHYPPDVVRRIRFIRRAKELGFTLREIGELLSLRIDPQTTCADVRTLARAKLADVETRITELSRMRDVLAQLAQLCRGKGPPSECPILDLLDRGERDGV